MQGEHLGLETRPFLMAPGDLVEAKQLERAARPPGGFLRRASFSGAPVDAGADVPDPSHVTTEEHVDPVVEHGVELCEDFFKRVRQLSSSSTMVHTPFSVRTGTCQALAECLANALDGGCAANILAEAFPKVCTLTARLCS